MDRPKPEGSKSKIAPGTQLPKPKKPEPPRETEKPRAPFRPKRPMGPRYAERPSVWHSLADILHDNEDDR